MARPTPLSDSSPQARGIIRCLRLLAEEAEALGLPRTHLAICQVLRICEAERTQRPRSAAPGDGFPLQ
jgi:hypothetical protein